MTHVPTGMGPVASSNRAAAVTVFAGALVFYVWTLSPSVGWGDAVRLQLDAALGGSTYWYLEEVDRTAGDGWPFQFLGVAAWDHPLYVLLVQAFVALPGPNLAWRVNLFSALSAALAVAGLFLVGFRMTGDRRAAGLAAAALAVSHTFWFQAVTAEVYALHAVFMLVLVGFVLHRAESASRRAWWTTAFVAGLATANHFFFLLTVATVLACLPRGSFKRVRSGDVVALAGGFLLGLAPWWIQFLRMSMVTGLWSTVQTVTGLPVLADRLWADSIVAGLKNLASYAAFLTYQFTPFGVAVGLWGFLSLQRRAPTAFRLLLSLFVVHALFSANYQVADRYTFHVFSYVIFALAMAAGFGRLLAVLTSKWRNRPELMTAGAIGLAGLVISPVAIYAVTPRALRAAGIEDATLGIPSIGTGARNGIEYFLNPNRRHDDSAGRFGRTTLDSLAPGALVLAPKESDQETYLVLRYFQLVERRRPDVELDLALSASTHAVPAFILERVRTAASCRPVYFASLNPRWYPIDDVAGTFTVAAEAGLYRVRLVDDPPPPQTCVSGRSARPAVPVHKLVQEALRKR